MSRYPIQYSRLSWAVVGLELCDSDSDLATRIKHLLLTTTEPFPQLEAPCPQVKRRIEEAFTRIDRRQRQLYPPIAAR